MAAEIYNPNVVNEPKKRFGIKRRNHSTKKPTSKSTAPEPPPPSPVVVQLMEMGFPRPCIEFAIKVYVNALYKSI